MKAGRQGTVVCLDDIQPVPLDNLFTKNLQGDIVGIYTPDGTKVAEYRYDTWGNHVVYDSTGAQNTTSTFIGNINPFRYRGYYFDQVSGVNKLGYTIKNGVNFGNRTFSNGYVHEYIRTLPTAVAVFAIWYSYGAAVPALAQVG